MPDKIVERVKAMAKGGFVGLHELVDRATDEPTPTIERDATGALVLREKKVDAHSRAAADRKIGQVERVKLLRRLVAALKIVGSPVESLFRTHLDRIVEMFDDQAKHVPEVVAEYDVRCRVAYAAGPFNIGTYQPEIYLQAATAVQQAAITRAVGLARSAPAVVGASPTSGGSGTGGQRRGKRAANEPADAQRPAQRSFRRCFRCGADHDPAGHCADKTTAGRDLFARDGQQRIVSSDGRIVCASWLKRGTCDRQPCDRAHICTLCRQGDHGPLYCARRV